MSLSREIKTEALRLGFTLAGITTPEPPPHLAVFQHWLALGRNATMGYVADPRRLDPHLVLPGCRSILVLAAPHAAPGTGAGLGLDQALSPAPVQAQGYVAAYAWGRDYHLALPERMEELVAFIETQVGRPVPHRCLTDSGPLLERDLAQRAGLGWIGKNTCLIHPRLGSYILLAEILLGIDLEPDAPFTPDRCGTCTRCIRACPTACILPDRTLDARQCISYLTIENKGVIPVELRPALGNRVFGCDICQQVCPWNRFAGESTPALAPNPLIPFPDLAKEILLTPAQFKEKFKDSPLLRSKHRGYLRNVAVALGNAGEPAALPALEQAYAQAEPLVQEHIAWAIEQIHNRAKDSN